MSEATGDIQYPIDQSYGVTRTRRHTSGLLVIPVAGPFGTPPEIVRVHGGVDTLDVAFSADKLSAPPIVPSIFLQDNNSLLLDGSQIVTLPMIQQQGNHHWSISGNYSYVSKQLIGLNAPLPTGKMPFETAGSAVQNTIPASNLQTGIVQGDGSIPKIPIPNYVPDLGQVTFLNPYPAPP